MKQDPTLTVNAAFDDALEDALRRGVTLADSIAADFDFDPDAVAAEVVRQIPELRAERDPAIVTESELRLLDGNR